jgi:monoterpene epsilon-lactone hydrolase
LKNASWQAHVMAWILRRRLKPRLAKARDIATARALFTPPPFRVPRAVTLTPGRVGGVPGEWLSGPTEQATLLYLHGGGYFGCSPETHRPITAGFAKLGFRVFAPDYRLAPENPFPAALDDARTVYLGLLEQGVAASALMLAGDSAGGGLSLALMLSLSDAGLPLPAAAAVFSPWTDLAATGASVRTNDRRCAMFRGERIASEARHYLGNADPCNPLASPLYGKLSHLPPLIIHVGADEVLLDDSTRFAARAQAAGVPVELKVWPVVPHAWQLAQTTVPEARESLGEAAGFLLEATANAGRVRAGHIPV